MTCPDCAVCRCPDVGRAIDCPVHVHEEAVKMAEAHVAPPVLEEKAQEARAGAPAPRTESDVLPDHLWLTRDAFRGIDAPPEGCVAVYDGEEGAFCFYADVDDLERLLAHAKAALGYERLRGAPQETAALKEGKEVVPSADAGFDTAAELPVRSTASAPATPGAVSQQPGTAPASKKCPHGYEYAAECPECFLDLEPLPDAPPSAALPKEEVAPTCNDDCEGFCEAEQTTPHRRGVHGDGQHSGCVLWTCAALENGEHISPFPPAAWVAIPTPATPSEAADRAVGYCRHVNPGYPHDWACARCIAYWIERYAAQSEAEAQATTDVLLELTRPAPQPLPEEQLPKEGVAAAPTLLVKALFEVDEPEPETGPDPDHGMDAAAPAPGDADETNLQVHAAVGHVRFLLLALDGGCDTRTTMRSIRDAREWVEARQKEHAERLARARASDATSAGGGE